METYNSAPDSLKFTTIDEFEHKINNILAFKNKNSYYSNIRKLRGVAEKRILEKDENVRAYLESLNTPWGSSDRVNLKRWN
jgi:hypothetical protein